MQNVDCLAAIHACWWNDPQLRAAVELRDDEWYARRTTSVSDIFVRFLAEVGGHLSPAMRAALEAVVDYHPILLHHPLNGNLTVAHGDAHCWSFLNPRDPATPPAYLIDWECWDIESGTNDLASLMAVQWFSDLRRELERPLVERYHRGLVAQGVTDYGFGACWNDYRFSVIERVLNPLYQWNRGRQVDSWWANLARVTTTYHDLGCAELIA